MIDEEKGLSEKLEAAKNFIVGVVFSNQLTLGEQTLLRAQVTFMEGYVNILRQRMELADRLS